MKITLDANPYDAPGYARVIAEDGRNYLIQRDGQFCCLARYFGFRREDLVNVYAPFCQHLYAHHGEDCPDCGFQAGNFIHAARAYLVAHHGAKRDDPGYFAPARTDYSKVPGQQWREELSTAQLHLVERFDDFAWVSREQFDDICACDRLAQRIAAYVIHRLQREAGRRTQLKRVGANWRTLLRLTLEKLNEY